MVEFVGEAGAYCGWKQESIPLKNAWCFRSQGCRSCLTPATIMRVARVKDRTAIAVCQRWQWVTCMQAGTFSGSAFLAIVLLRCYRRRPEQKSCSETGDSHDSPEGVLQIWELTASHSIRATNSSCSLSARGPSYVRRSSSFVLRCRRETLASTTIV